jgi:hypothetical protein
MRSWLLTAGLLTGLVLALPESAPAQKKKDKFDDKTAPATPQDYATLNTAKEAVGLWTRVEAKDAAVGTSLTFKVPYQTADLKNANAAVNMNAQLQKLQAQQQQAMAITNPQKQAKKLQQIQNQMAKLQQRIQNNVKYTLRYKEFELLPTEKFEVRWQKPKTVFDDKGNVKEYTKEELKKLKGDDPNKVGYDGAVEDLTAGQYVKVFLVPDKKKPAPKDSSKDVSKGETEATPPDPFEGRPRVSMVLILADAGLPSALDTTPDRKNK